METINCPVCGESNPASLKNCQSCQQPLRQSTSELDGAGKIIDSGQNPTIKKTSELEATLPAWLKNARQGERKDEEQEPAPPSPRAEPEIAAEENQVEDAAAPLDWLAGLDDTEEDDEEAADWLVNLQGDTTPEEEEIVLPDIPAADEPITAGDMPQPSTEEEAPIQTGELPGWISDLQGESATEEAEALPDLFTEEENPPQELIADTGDTESGGLPDWLSTLSKESDSDPAPVETPSVQPASPLEADTDSPSIDADESLPDWMAELRAPASAETSPEEPAPAIASSDVPLDWASSSDDASPVAEEVIGTDSDIPDWMAGSDDASPATEEAISTDNDLPDWMAGSDDAPPAAEEAISTGDDLPDWMAGLKPDAEISPEESALVAEEEISVSEDLPDWMAKLKPADETLAGEAEEENLISAEGDTPDWLSSLPSEDFSAKGAEREDAPLADDLFGGEASQKESDSFADLTVDADEADIAPAEEADVPDWLSQIEQPAASSDEEKADETPAFSSEEAETPEWLDDLPAIDGHSEEATPPAEATFVERDAFSGATEEDTEEMFGIDMPDWLSSLGPEDSDEEEGSEAEAVESTGEVSGAELPSWVQAMRPVADVVPDSSRPSDDQVAGTGPLAGISGVLPVASAMAQINKPQAHSIKLRVSESQQSSAAMFEELLAGESKPSPFSAASTTSSIPLLRWIIAILLFGVIGFSLFSQSKTVASPDMDAAEVQSAVDIINQLPAGGSALLVFDYEAGFSGEMKAVAAPLVDQIMSRGEKLAIISTSPTGPALAENFLLETQSKYQFFAGENYRNLGYLPGGTSGMLSFISNPRQAIVARIDGVSIWDSSPLENVVRFSDFSLVVILTDDVEKGRAWIEQSAATLDEAGTPLLMGISAQAEPIIYPYYASGQVDGLVSGLSGGMIYEGIQNQEGLSRKYWDSYSVGLLLAEILIALGAVVNFLAALNARQKSQKEEN